MPDIPQPRYLFVGNDATWRGVTADVAARRGAILDEMPTVASALAWMLPPGQVYDLVLAEGPLDSRSADALAGMLDEVTLRPTPLLLLRCGSSSLAMRLPCVDEPSVEAVLARLDGLRPSHRRSAATLPVADIASALHAGGLRMRFQPILRAADLVPIGLEALARLYDGVHGILHPKEFIPPAIAGGRERVLTAVAAARTFLEIGQQLPETGLFVTVNLPLQTVTHEAAVQRGLELCGVAGVPPSDIVIEVLETHLAPDLDLLGRALTAWRAAGFRTAIDDAGPSLPHWRDLLDLPFNALKLDGTMVADPSQMGLLTSIVHAARARGLFTVAEGIEDAASLARVTELGVDALQGFLFSRPLPALAVPIWLRHWAERLGKEDVLF